MIRSLAGFPREEAGWNPAGRKSLRIGVLYPAPMNEFWKALLRGSPGQPGVVATNPSRGGPAPSAGVVYGKNRGDNER